MLGSPFHRSAHHFRQRAKSLRGQLRPTCVDVLCWDQLSDEELKAWESFRTDQAAYRSPFFSTEFTAAVHASRGDVSVAVLRHQEQPIGFVPFHAVGRRAVPVGRYLNDAHNVIAARNVSFDWLWLLEQCNLKTYDFHALVRLPDETLSEHCQGTTESFAAHLGCDSREFLKRLERDHKTIRRQEQKSRKMAREVGPLRLEIDCRQGELLEKAIDWKRDQYKRTNILDLFAPRWTRQMLRNLHGIERGKTRGILSVLRAGETVVAAHFGMLDGTLLHYWFPCYDTQFARYSPGTALFKEIVRASTEFGIDCIDMGYGELPYKRKQTDTITSVSYGCVTSSRVYRQWNLATHAAGIALKKVPMKQQLKKMLRTFHPHAGISKLG